MTCYNLAMKRGYTLVEILVVLGIAAVILSIVITSFYNLTKTQALNRDYLSIASFIDQAKSLSINSKSASQYGVYFSTSSVVLFKGQSYLATSTANQVYLLNGRVSISAISLVGSSTNQVVFDRLTGQASASGTIAVSLKDNSAAAKTIKIYKTGTVEYK